MAGINLQIKFDDNMSKMLERLEQDVEQLKSDAFDVFVDNTPVRTGNARRKTRKKKDTIDANYAYADRLDKGYSKQSPDGMTKPTLDYIDDRFKKIAKGK